MICLKYRIANDPRIYFFTSLKLKLKKYPGIEWQKARRLRVFSVIFERRRKQRKIFFLSSFPFLTNSSVCGGLVRPYLYLSQVGVHSFLHLWASCLLTDWVNHWLIGVSTSSEGQEHAHAAPLKIRGFLNSVLRFYVWLYVKNCHIRKSQKTTTQQHHGYYHSRSGCSTSFCQ